MFPPCSRSCVLPARPGSSESGCCEPSEDAGGGRDRDLAELQDMTGTMQRYALTVDKFLEHAAKWHGGAEVVSASPAGGISRRTYAGLRQRSLLLSGGFLARGLEIGDRIATLA